jgi:hypothetical protein
MSEKNEDYLKKYIQENTDTPVTNNFGGGSNFDDGDDGGGNDGDKSPKGKLPNDNEFINVDMDSLPMKWFYKNGTQIKIRAARVEEIQAYSVVDNNNIIDIHEKMNQMLSSCTRFYYPDKSIGTYKDIKDGDRLFLIFQIRELTFQTGPALSKEVQCEHCNHEFSIIYRTTKNNQYPRTLYSHEFQEKLEKYYNKHLKCFSIKIDGVEYNLAPPTIGIQESFFTDIRKKVQINQKRKPNVAQMKLLQFLLWDRNYISEEGIKKRENEIKQMDMKTFQILNSAVDRMEFGLKELKQECPSCSGEVCSEITFPGGASNIFVVPDFFDEFDRQ